MPGKLMHSSFVVHLHITMTIRCVMTGLMGSCVASVFCSCWTDNLQLTPRHRCPVPNGKLQMRNTSAAMKLLLMH
ncbi:hypothetical protein F5141DRAFT_1122964 [Pisolithus sp. B1]|nr:hypothetical protein F5141DRAFT_1122964 [Pisolithus sp. B1]